MQKLISDIKNLLTAPIIGEVDTTQLWLVVGVVLVSLFVWGMILRTIKLAASEV